LVLVQTMQRGMQATQVAIESIEGMNDDDIELVSFGTSHQGLQSGAIAESVR
jgi:hypothetical protein